jgi:PhnB protein
MTISALYPRLVATDASGAIDFYTAVFGAKELARYTDPQGKIVHAELEIGGAKVAIKDEDDGDPSPIRLGGTPVIMALQVDDADAVADRIVRAGGTVIYPVSDQPHGERGGRLADPFGHLWIISQQIEKLTPEEIQRRTEVIS